MPERIICHRCSFILYEGDEPLPPEEIVKRFGGRCPRCLAELSYAPITIEISRTEERKRKLFRG